MRRLTIGLVAVFAMLTILPLGTVYFLVNGSRTTNSENADLQAQINELNQQNDQLRQENQQLKEANSQLANISKPYLAAKLGWYLHKSNDPVSSARNSFNIYGTIANLGLINCTNAYLEIMFLGNSTILQKSTINLKPIAALDVLQLSNRRIDCAVADSVTKTEITVNYT